MSEILISAGEASGDILGAKFIEEFIRLHPHVGFYGLGGDRMAERSCELLYHIRDLSILGFWEVVKNIGFIRAVQKKIMLSIESRKPVMAVLIDYPGFNLRLARILRRHGIKVFYYVSPQVWAWGKRRISDIRNNVDLMAVFFDFEKRIFDDAGIPAVCVGHPMLDHVKIDHDRETFRKILGVRSDQEIIGLFPGSRKQEIRLILPQMLIAAKKLTTAIGAGFFIGKAPSIETSFYMDILKKEKGAAELFEGNGYDLMAHSRLNLICSGTATLESAVLGTPMIIVYKTSTLTYFIARSLIKIPVIGLVNVVAGRKVVPELIQNRCTGAEMAEAAMQMLENEARYEIVRRDLLEVKSRLGSPGASARAAEAAFGLLNP